MTSGTRNRWFRDVNVAIPTLRTWLVVVTMGGALLALCILRVHPFLAVTEPVGTGLLVVEGWMPDVVIPQVLRILEEGNYVAVIATGGKVPQGTYLADYGSFAEIMAQSLAPLTQGIPVHAVPAGQVEVDRTFASALAIRQWIKGSELEKLRQIEVVTEGAHARRSRLLFSLALGDTFEVGVIALEPDIDSAIWWRSSAGVRTIIGEAVGYGYAKVLFWPESPTAVHSRTY